MSEVEHIERQAADWLARRDGEHWSAQDELALQAWIDEALVHRIAYLRLRSLWQRADRLSSLRVPATHFTSAVANAPSPAMQHPNAVETRHWPPVANPRRWRALAGVVAIVGATLLLAQSGWRSDADSYATALGQRRAVTLVDGSRLLLNTDTRLQIDLGSRRRLVRLDRGEAYFEVAHDAARPFVIDAGNSRITVLGTKFSVRRDLDQVAVVVTEGRVKVEPINVPAGSAITTITRNDELVTSRNNLIVARKSDAQVADALSWRHGQLVFDQVTLAQAAAEFNRYNEKKLLITDAETGKVLLGGRFDTNNVSGFAHLLHAGLGLRVDERSADIRVSR